MALTKAAYERKTLWLKPIKCELIAFVLWPDLFAENRKKAIALARASKRWGSIRHFEDDELATLKKYKKVLNEIKSISKLKKALCPTESKEAAKKGGKNQKVRSV